MEAPTPQQPTVTVQGLAALYAALGQQTHRACEAEARLEQALALLKRLQEQYAPNDAPSDGEDGG